MKLKYEFDTMEELQEAMKHLEDYHDCEKCHGKIVGICVDDLGRTHCGYCYKIVQYPKLRQGSFIKILKLEEDSSKD